MIVLLWKQLFFNLGTMPRNPNKYSKTDLMYGTRFHSGKKGIFQFSKLVKSNSEFGSDFRLTKKIMGQNSPPPQKAIFFYFWAEKF